MTVLITGGAGFLGRRLAQAILAKGVLAGPDDAPHRVDRVRLLDVAAAQPMDDSRVTVATGDISDPRVLERAIDAETTSIFHLAAIVSGQAEADFDLGLRINLDATRHLLDVCRACGHRPRVVFTSSVAVFGGALPDPVPDTQALTPESSYGAEKAIGELLVSDYSRRGFVDGRALRLPTISVRPGRPNAALSSFASGIIREPINGEIAVCPVSPETRLWLLSPSTAIKGLIHGHELASSAFGSHRAVSLPGLSVSVREMVASLARVAGPDASARIRWEPDPNVERVAGSWPAALDTVRARDMGFPTDTNFDDIVRQYLEHERQGNRVS